MMIVAFMVGARMLVVVVFVAVCLFVGPIVRVFTSLFVRMLSVLNMQVRGLKTLVLA
jgi:hypothetical protein